MTVQVELDLRRQLQKQVDDLALEFRGVFSRETVQAVADEALDSLSDRAFADFVPVLVHRFARERLCARGQVEGRITKAVPEVLFVCAHNAGRSQMAAALTNLRGRGRVHVRSAGSDPGDRIDAAVEEAMREFSIDLHEEFPKPLTTDVVQAADIVVTMGCGDACPVYPGKRYVDWELTDPAGRPLTEVRAIRDEIDARVQALLRELLR